MDIDISSTGVRDAMTAIHDGLDEGLVAQAVSALESGAQPLLGAAGSTDMFIRSFDSQVMSKTLAALATGVPASSASPSGMDSETQTTMLEGVYGSGGVLDTLV